MNHHSQPQQTQIRRRTFLRSALASSATLAITGCHSLIESHSPTQPVPAASGPRALTRPGAIDAHMHVVVGNPDLKPGVPETDKLMTAEPSVVAARVRLEMEQSNTAYIFAMGQRNGTGADPLGLERSLRVAELVPGMMVIGIADPLRTGRAHLRAVEDQIQRERQRLVAFKGYLGYIHAGPDHSGYEPYIRLAAKYGLPFVFHTGDTWSLKARLSFAHPLGVDAVATKFPEVRFVLAHFGNPWLIDAAEVIFKNDNVWADLSGLCVVDETMLNTFLNDANRPEVVPGGVIVSDLRKALAFAERYDRVLYGTDWPLAPMAAYRRFIEFVIPKQHHEKVFRTNSEQLFFALK